MPQAQCWGDWGGEGVAGKGQAWLFHFSLQTSKAFTTTAFSTLICFPRGLLVKVKSLGSVRLFVTPWTTAYQSPPSMGFSRLERWGGLPFPSPGDLPDPGIEPKSPAWLADSLQSEPPLTCSLSTKSRPEIHPTFAGQQERPPRRTAGVV